MVKRKLRAVWYVPLAMSCAQGGSGRSQLTDGESSAVFTTAEVTTAMLTNSEAGTTGRTSSSALPTSANGSATTTAPSPPETATQAGQSSGSSSVSVTSAETSHPAPSSHADTTTAPATHTSNQHSSTATDSSTTNASTPPGPGCTASASGQRPEPLKLSGNTFAHDPTMIAVGDTVVRFWTGDFVPSAKSTDLLNWTNAPSVYATQQYPSWVNDWKAQNPGTTFNFPWAPDVSFFGGKYHLYASFSAFFGRNSSCITHLSTEDPIAGKWLDHGPVVCSEEGDTFNAIDADVGLNAAGEPWLAFGSFWDGIYAFPLTEEGERLGSELTHLAWAPEIEAPVLFYRCGYYYLLVSWGLCCPGEGRDVNALSYRVAVGRAATIEGPYVDRDGVALTEGGGTVIVQADHVTFAAAGHSDVLLWNDRVYHLYHAYRQANGNAELRIVELPFDDEGWPIGGPP